MSKMTPQIRFQGFTDDWEERKLGDIFDYEQPTKYIVQSTEYDDTFNTPVLTAGKSFLLGYTDEISGIKNATVENPVVIFDDFTTGSHYVDFSFKIKSSAMKLLSLNDNSDNFYFMFNTLKNIKYVPQSHERHWISKFSEFEIYKPSQEEQQKIGSFFKQLDDTIALHQRMLDLLKEQKKGFLQKMFPKNGAKVPELRFSGFADDWEERKLGELSNIVGGGTPSTSNPEYWDGDIDWYAPAEIGEQSYVSKSKKTITELGLKKSSARMLPVGTVLFTSRAGIGNTAILAKEATTNQGFQSIVPDQNKLDSYFIFSRTNELKRYGEVTGAGSTFVEVSGKQMSKMSIMVPELSEQQKIGSFFKQLDETIALHQRKLDLLKKQKKGFLQKMFVS
ncbi:restriction endonuclease subunit S [Leuconostoc suionicum]|uniref:restriction endonuclease subunit S n=1 Tax=Leuconostoc suionicum TaxID=1511761 RepID=UPI0029542E69|nr:restriction endonuclease subunit S [Leuconostoc suionicum]MDV7703557.1 restriction endonuclease subunit S [Leuconostoc suionicum]